MFDSTVLWACLKEQYPVAWGAASTFSFYRKAWLVHIGSCDYYGCAAVYIVSTSKMDITNQAIG